MAEAEEIPNSRPKLVEEAAERKNEAQDDTCD